MTLRVRIIALSILFAAFLVTGFGAIQVVSHLHTLNEHNTYRARVGSSAAKTALEYALAVQQAQRPTEDPLPALKQELLRLRHAELFDRAALLTVAGQTLASSELLPSPDAQEARWAPYAVTTYSPAQWLYTTVTPTAIHAFVPLLQQQKPRYVARLTFELANIRQAIRDVYAACVGVALGVLALSMLLAWSLTRAILKPIHTLNEVTRDIAAGNLASKAYVDTGDELEELAATFNEMGDALVTMKARAENTNPLTKLPGNTVIREEIEKRLAAHTTFVAIYADLDHFKAFNDKYGIAAGDRAISLTAQVMHEGLRHGNPDDFLGHEGGDDFVLLTTPQQAEPVTQFICREFDQRIRALYAPDDLARGAIRSTDREGNAKEFPIMTISLAGVTNAHRPITSYAEVTNIFAEVKKRAKRTSFEARRSTFALDRRHGEHPSATASRPPPQSA